MGVTLGFGGLEAGSFAEKEPPLDRCPGSRAGLEFPASTGLVSAPEGVAMGGSVLQSGAAGDLVLIRGDDGKTYRFEVTSGLTLRPGDRVDYLAEGDFAVDLHRLVPDPAETGLAGARPSIIIRFWRCVTRDVFRAEGRASRTEYFSFVLISGGVTLAVTGLGVLLVPLAILARDQADLLATASGVLMVLGLAIYGLLIIPGTTVLIRRLHDQGRSGWWILLALVPSGLIALFVMTLLPGDTLSNRFGAPPI